MRRFVALSVMAAGLLAGCRHPAPPPSGGTAWPSTAPSTEELAARYDEQLRKADQIQAVTEEQLRRSDLRLKRDEASAPRSELLLTKWEEQAKRFDAILDRWEALLTALERAQGTASTLPVTSSSE